MKEQKPRNQNFKADDYQWKADVQKRSHAISIRGYNGLLFMVDGNEIFRNGRFTIRLVCKMVFLKWHGPLFRTPNPTSSPKRALKYEKSIFLWCCFLCLDMALLWPLRFISFKRDILFVSLDSKQTTSAR